MFNPPSTRRSVPRSVSKIRSRFYTTFLGRQSIALLLIYALHVLIDDFTYSWTHREWGHMMAKWANSEEWLGCNEWQYLDFYGGLNDRLIEHYNPWSATAMRVIEVKG